MRRSSAAHKPLGNQGHQRLMEGPPLYISMKLNSTVKEPPLSTMKTRRPLENTIRRPPPSISAFDLRENRSSTSSSILTPVLRSSISPSPRAMVTPEVESLRKQLENLETKFQSISTRFREQAELHACDKARAERYEHECERLQSLLDNRKKPALIDASVQTNAEYTTPSPTPPPLLPVVIRRPSPLPSRRILAGEETISIGTSPMRFHASTSSSPARRTPTRWSKSPIAARIEEPSGGSIKPTSTISATPACNMTPSTALVRAKNLLDNLQDSKASIYSHFDQLDNGKTGSLSRDLCLAMISLVFEEKQIRRTSNIPKVICSRMLRSIGSCTGGVSSNRSASSSSNSTLQRENLLEFFKLVLDFVIEEERVTPVVSNQSSG